VQPGNVERIVVIGAAGDVFDPGLREHRIEVVFFGQIIDKFRCQSYQNFLEIFI
jgi:hypothetical protein